MRLLLKVLEYETELIDMYGFYWVLSFGRSSQTLLNMFHLFKVIHIYEFLFRILETFSKSLIETHRSFFTTISMCFACS